jgi:hypothetical protein
MARLTGISIQVQGAQALLQPAIAEQLGISDEQMGQIRQANREAMQELMSQMRDLFQSGDREQATAKMAELRKQADEKVMALLTGEQREKLDQIKGEPFEMPPGAMRGLGRGRGGPGRGQRQN